MELTLLNRVTLLESEAHQRRHLDDARDGKIEHLTNAVGDLSQGQRSLALDVRENSDRLTAVEAGLSAVKAELGEMRAELGAVKAELGEMRAELGTMREALAANTDLLRQVLARLGTGTAAQF